MQALVLLNDPTYVEAAQALAGRVAAQPGDDATRLTWAYQQVLQRAPTEAEQAVLTPLLGASAPEAAAADDPARWVPVARVLLNLHETIARY